MRWLILFLFILAVGGLLVWGGLSLIGHQKPSLLSPLPSSTPKVNYTPYSFENLQKREYFGSEIKIEGLLKQEETFNSYLFSYVSEGRKITGSANILKRKGRVPVAILLRGWVDEKSYQTGMGTQKMGEFLAQNGFLTLAPDFLGYGGSDPAIPDILLNRFFRPITVISLLKALPSLSQADSEKVVFWGHSNGGQIALSVLEITGKKIPTSLWAPVSAPFPEGILSFVDEMEDGGLKIRQVLSEFEKEYDSQSYSITTYFNQIQAPIVVHQGTSDEAIPEEWSDTLVGKLRKMGKEVIYFKYQGENHNFTRGSGPKARERDLDFFAIHLRT